MSPLRFSNKECGDGLPWTLHFGEPCLRTMAGIASQGPALMFDEFGIQVLCRVPSRARLFVKRFAACNAVIALKRNGCLLGCYLFVRM